MNTAFLYALTGIGLVALGMFALFSYVHLLRKILALNVLGTGVFMVFIALAARTPYGPPDPVPQAMVLTGIVVAVSATGLALSLAVRLQRATGAAQLPGESGEGEAE